MYLTYKINHGWNPWIIFQIRPNQLRLIQIWSLLWAGGLCLWLFLSTFSVTTHIVLLIKKLWKFSFHFLQTPHHSRKGQWNLNSVWDGDVKICLERPNVVMVHFLHTTHIFQWVKMEQGWVKFLNRIITEAISSQFMNFLSLKKRKKKRKRGSCYLSNTSCRRQSWSWKKQSGEVLHINAAHMNVVCCVCVCVSWLSQMC